MTTVLSAEWVLPVDGPPIEDGAVAYEDGRIVEVGTASALGRGEHFVGAAIVPGLVNAHSHIEYAVYSGFGDGLAFDRWITLHIERKARLDFEEMTAIARAGAGELLRSGVTTTGDLAFSGAAAIAMAELGLRGIVYLEVFGDDPVAGLARFHELRERVAGSIDDELVQLGVSPHAPYSTTADTYHACAALSLPVATHVAESDAETVWMTSGEGTWREYAAIFPPPPGKTSVRHLYDEGLLGPGVAAGHCVKVDAEDIELLRRSGAGVAHCPRSNATLGCGIAPVTDLLEAGVPVGVGTDSPASTPSLDMFEELRAAAWAARFREGRPDVMTGPQALELATLGSARVLGMEGEIGSLSAGKRADLAVISLQESGYHPVEDPATAVVFGGSPERVLLTVVGGEERYRKGKTDWRRLRSAASNARRTLLGLSAPATTTARSSRPSAS